MKRIALLIGFVLWSLALGAAEPILFEPHFNRAGGFECIIVGEPGQIYEIQVSRDLTSWSSLRQLELTHAVQRFEDPAAANHDRRFYRAVGPVRETSSEVLRVFPELVSPGMTLRVTTVRPIFGPQSSGRMLVEGLNAPTRWIGRSNEVEVLVPLLPAGFAVLQVLEPGKRPGIRHGFRILPPRTQLMLLTFQGGQVRLLSRRMHGGEFTRAAAADQRRLSLDILNERGGLVYTASIPHPAESGLEVFAEAREGAFPLHHATPQDAAVFDLKVPHLPGPGLVRCYEAAPGVDLSTERGRGLRRFVNEIEMRGGNEP